jgi:hypothetical protein
VPTDRAVDDAETDGQRLLTPRRRRRMTRTHAVLWAVILLTTAADIVLTLVGLAAGLPEGNPVVRSLVSSFGPAGLFAVKFAAMCWLVAGWALLSDWKASVFLGLFAAVTSLVVLTNAVVVLGV